MGYLFHQGAKAVIYAALLLTVCLAAASSADEAEPAKPEAGAPVGAPGGGGITDEQVVASMKKGIDYLLSVRQGDNWEIANVCNWVPDREKGGQTAMALYALLHAGDSLQDNPDYHSKLHWRGKELLPAVKWLEANPTEDTYVVGLEASALTLPIKNPDEKPGEGVRGALDDCRLYLLGAMGQHGGYTYTFPVKPKDHESFAELWGAYYSALRGGNQAEQAELKKAVDDYVIAAQGTFGGQLFEFQRLIIELRNQVKTTHDPKYEGELRELEKYTHAMPQQQSWESRGASAKKSYDDLVAKQEKGDKSADLDAKISSAKKWLEKTEGEKGAFYPIGDLSNSQYGTLGAWALMDYGMEMPDAYWQTQDRFWRKLQWADGSWPYLSFGATGSKDTMGVAGIASLFVCQEFVDTELRLIPKPDKNIDAGLAWLTGAYKPGSQDYYYMYGVERVGLASGFKFFGTTNWYKEGAAAIVAHQKADGSWSSNLVPHLGTSYALLFLARGRNPVVFNKLQYNGPWNARPRDDAYITRWLSKRFEKPINWQVVNLQVSPDEWLDAPVLLITGSADPKFTKEDLDKMRAFVNAGGMIFSTSDGATLAFSTAMKKYAAALVDNKYEWRLLPKNHPLFSKEMGVDIPNPPPLFGMSNGSREIWIHSMADIGADWQMRRFASKSSFELGAALYFYASGTASLRSKLQPLTVDVGSAAAVRGIDVARVDYPGNADPEPGAWPRMAKLARANFKTQVNLTAVPFAQLDAKKYPLAHLTGTTHVTFTEEEVKGLKAYLDAGGVLFADATGGGADFAASCQELIKQVYPDSPPSLLPPDHPILTGAMPDGVKIQDVEFRKYGNIRLHRRVTTPALEGVIIDGHVRILFSPWDICSGFLGTNTWGIVGYAPSSSEKLGRNILLYAINPNATTAPAPQNP